MKWTKWDGTGRRREFIDPQRDEIFYYREYTAGKDYTHSPTNSLVKNLKMGPNPHNPAMLPHRERAIQAFSGELRQLLEHTNKDLYITWMPSSKSPDDADFDDRLVRVVRAASRHLELVHPLEIIYTESSRAPLHHGGKRDPQKLMATYAWRKVDLGKYKYLVVVDDVLTHGTNFRACCDTIRTRYPDLSVTGVVWAVTVDLA